MPPTFPPDSLGQVWLFNEYWISTLPNTEQSLKVWKDCLAVIVQGTPPHLANTKGKESCFPRKKKVGSSELCNPCRHLPVRKIWFVTHSVGSCLGNLHFHLPGMTGGLKCPVSVPVMDTGCKVYQLPFQCPRGKISYCNTLQPCRKHTTFLHFAFFSVFPFISLPGAQSRG